MITIAAVVLAVNFCGAPAPGTTPTTWWRARDDGMCYIEDMWYLYVRSCPPETTISDDGAACVPFPVAPTKER